MGAEPMTDKPNGKRWRWGTIGAAILAAYSISGLVLVTLDQLHVLNRAVVEVVRLPFVPLFWIVGLLNIVIESAINR
jgi:hypothetical protein